MVALILNTKTRSADKWLALAKP